MVSYSTVEVCPIVDDCRCDVDCLIVDVPASVDVLAAVDVLRIEDVPNSVEVYNDVV